MVKCTGCKRKYHPKCLAKHFETDDDTFHKSNLPKNWCCNVKYSCAHLRTNEYMEIYCENNYLFSKGITYILHFFDIFIAFLNRYNK